MGSKVRAEQVSGPVPPKDAGPQDPTRQPKSGSGVPSQHGWGCGTPPHSTDNGNRAGGAAGGMPPAQDTPKPKEVQN